MEYNRIFNCDCGPISASIYQNQNDTINLILSYNNQDIMNENFPNSNFYDNEILYGILPPYKVTKTNSLRRTVIIFYLNDEIKSEIGIDHLTKRVSYVADVSKKSNSSSNTSTSTSTNNKVYTFSYTGSDQTFQVPTNAKKVVVECWGAGGASQGYGAVPMYNTGSGGGGGYTKAEIPHVAGSTLNIVVGQGGQTNNNGVNSNETYGGGGGQNLSGDSNWGSASGGGRSAVQMMISGEYIDVVTAGGGGAAGGNSESGSSAYYGLGSGGPGGGLKGGNAEQLSGIPNYGGTGGSQTEGGDNGLQSIGVTAYVYDGTLNKGGGGSQYGSGGGSGFYGGGYGGVITFNGLTENSSNLVEPVVYSSNMVLWLDASVSSSVQLDSNGGVTQWIDQSPSKANALPYLGVCGYKKNALNNLPGVTINDAGLYSPIPAGTFSNGFTFFVVFSNVGNQTYNTLIERSDPVNTNYPAPWGNYNGLRYIGNSSTNGFFYANSTNTFSKSMGPTIFTYQSSPSMETKEWFNGSNIFYFWATAYYQDTGEYIYIGTRGDKYITFNGVMSEIIVYNTYLTVDQINSVNGYLSKKWGIDITELADSSTTISNTSGNYWVFGGGGGGSSFVNNTYALPLSLEQGEGNKVAGSTYLPSNVNGNIGNGAVATNAVKGGASGQNGYVVITVSQ